MRTDDNTGSRLERISATNDNRAPNVAMRCPWCRHKVIFEPLSREVFDTKTNTRFAGFRKCPNTDCRGGVFMIMTSSGGVVDSFPPERLDFDPSHLPTEVLSRFEEAVNCHAAGAYRAAGAMLRATIESMCENRGAQGATLNARLQIVAEAAGVKTEYVTAMHALRLLGNDSVHAIAKDFTDVDSQLVTDAVEVVKTVLGVVYQHEAILGLLERYKSD